MKLDVVSPRTNPHAAKELHQLLDPVLLDPQECQLIHRKTLQELEAADLIVLAREDDGTVRGGLAIVGGLLFSLVVSHIARGQNISKRLCRKAVEVTKRNLKAHVRRLNGHPNAPSEKALLAADFARAEIVQIKWEGNFADLHLESTLQHGYYEVQVMRYECC
jgi:hypothetical protein